MTDKSLQPLLITGPTAVGKTALSLALAEEKHAEIISADSRQIYRELVIGTARPSEEELARVPHHFVGDRSIEEPCSAGSFAREAWQRMADIQQRGRQVLITGGSTLYIEALVKGLPDIPPPVAPVRQALQHLLETKGLEYLVHWLRHVDPHYAREDIVRNPRRVVRALEVYLTTGHPFSSLHGHRQGPPCNVIKVVLTRDREELYERINARVDKMLQQGLLEEVAALMERGYHHNELILQTIGYQEPVQYLEGIISYEEMVARLKRNTRRYARRQLTWFRNRLGRALWINLSEVDEEEALQRIQRAWECGISSEAVTPVDGRKASLPCPHPDR